MKPCEPCSLIGILDDGWAGLSDQARARLASADLVIGVERTLQMVQPYLAAGAETKSMEGALTRVDGWILQARQQGKRVVALATGDPLCHGIATWLTAKMGPELFDILPNVSALQLAFARFKQTWHDIRIASCHRGDAGEWFSGATPQHGLYPLMRAIALQRRVASFTGPANSPARLARALLIAGYGEEITLSVACCLQTPQEQLFSTLTLTEAAQMDFPQPNVLLVENNSPAQPLFGLPDQAYQQRSPDKGLITKQEARALSLAKLALRSDSLVWDIGAGSGSVGLEAARLASNGHVWAIEKNPADAANARANALHYRASNYTLCEGRAPALLDGWPDPDAIFIGGSGGELEQLITLSLQRLKPGGRLVMNFVTLENLASACATLSAAKAAWDVVQLQASRSQPVLDLHRMAAQNPVWIISASKETA
jgi:precorrin-6Y C5,15-methyltransferase (decarboxylating)